ncbi:MAG: peptide/nickel transport system permease protein [Thermoleophilaceae bacterium]|jgi:peptide/nickel transport system permease protein|nr:peptide/nickel transport system permease protein [Thermoleophilaceae bacterium]
MSTGGKIGVAVVAMLVAASVAAPLWAHSVAHTGPNTTHVSERVDGRDVISRDGSPIGPTWQGRFFLGADPEGRDVMVRLLYGGRTSLLIAFAASLVTALFACLAGFAAGWSRGSLDALVSRALDAVWAFPAILLAGSLGTALTLGGVSVGPLTIDAGSQLVPILVIGLVSVPYFARPLRAEVRALRGEEFVTASRALGASGPRILAREVAPNVVPTLAALAPVVMANSLLLEAALSFLGVGVQAPDASWGTLIAAGVERITTAPQLAVAPGLVLAATVLGVNLLAAAGRRALDPRAAAALL